MWSLEFSQFRLIYFENQYDKSYVIHYFNIVFEGFAGMPGMYAINTVNGLAMAGQLGYPLAAAQGAYGHPRTVGKFKFK